jgi:hypothetical protein
LKIDDEKLRAAFESGSAERYLGNDSFGFTQRLSQVARQADTNPEQFISFRSRNNMNSNQGGVREVDYESEYFRFMSAERNQRLTDIGLLLSMVV